MIKTSVLSSLENKVEKKTKEIVRGLSDLDSPLVFNANNRASNPTCTNSPIRLTNYLELKSMLKRMSNKTLTGLDEIPNVVIKKLTFAVIKNYVIIFNNALNLGYYPEIWKTAKLIVIKKKKK
ncbi:hypothetical protein TSAR_001054 [Trichomalopsis sarcophagae]|uniref:Uncharacterized protein n=1 Tax=Trichomalopsis sarcophagae TaxID=543379 RepID=A0A232FGK6_9HYME|nr:hypothetical protein TSAR_001054 [Trichomalopsis sarcophagae]